MHLTAGNATLVTTVVTTMEATMGTADGTAGRNHTPTTTATRKQDRTVETAASAPERTLIRPSMGPMPMASIPVTATSSHMIPSPP